jgi:alpha-galactosidase
MVINMLVNIKMKTPADMKIRMLLVAAFLFCGMVSYTQTGTQIVIETQHTGLVFSVHANGKLYQAYLGERFADKDAYRQLKQDCSGWLCRNEAYIPSGTDNLFEPAIRMVHADGNPSLELLYLKHSSVQKDSNKTVTTITLYDPKYPVTVNLIFTAWYKEDVIATHVEIQHNENKPVTLTSVASSMLHLNASNYQLTQFHGAHMSEMKMEESSLTSGIKMIDTKLGTRSEMFQMPVFMLSLNKPSSENSGELLAGTLAWSGNFRFVFELDEQNALRCISGINPFASDYQLKPNEIFSTPDFIFTYSNSGRGKASRSLHKWAINYGVLDGTKPRYTLLNNWESTYFKFNEQKIDSLIKKAAILGVDVFLLDDGWFGNKYPRDNDKAGLGDWESNKIKLPDGIGHLVKEAENNGVKFGIWIEPEMVNPKSELYEKHPEWVLKLPNRDESYYRNQLVLDLTNPKVQEYVFSVVDNLFSKNKNLAYIKWDCNRMMTSAFSSYLNENQSGLFIDYVRGLYRVWEQMRSKYPHVPMMLCSGGGGRIDYGALKYFMEIWPSDNTDGLERVYIQWGYSYFFPSLVLSAHITSMGQQSLKFRTDVAMSGKLGYDIDVQRFSDNELAYSKKAIENYKRIAPIIQQGNLYRLISPYEEKRAVLMYVNESATKAILFAYTLQTHTGDVFTRVRLQGLDTKKKYRVQEINLEAGKKSLFFENGKAYSGDYLMKAGMEVSSVKPLTSAIFEITEVF